MKKKERDTECKYFFFGELFEWPLDGQATYKTINGYEIRKLCLEKPFKIRRDSF